jgi:uncharacterized membrane protein
MKTGAGEALRRASARALKTVFDMPEKPDIRFVVRAAVIAALYAAITLLMHPISYGSLQFRISEALTLLPILTPAAVPGLFVGCLVANLFGSATLLDIVFGALATLLAARLTRRLRKRPVVAAIPPVAVNALVVGAVLAYTLRLPFWLTALEVGAGQIGACFGLGLPLLAALRRLPTQIWEI